jgi:hypothetical protein
MTQLSCTRPNCTVASGGPCLEGFDPAQTCPYLARSPASGSDEDQMAAFVDLPSGEALTEVEASSVTRQGITKVVIVAGPVLSGKTTILTSLYEAFLEAPFGNSLFAGSRTLVGFERRCHDGRSSNRARRQTLRTPISKLVNFLHLRLVPMKGAESDAQNLLLSDISGERFKALRDSAAAVREMPVLGRADHFCIVIDGEKLTNATLRHSARNDARSILRSVVESRVLQSTCRIQVAFTKWDMVVDQPDQKSLRQFVTDTRSSLQQAAAQHSTLEFFEIAARPEGTRVPFAYGLPTLLRSWLQSNRSQGNTRLYLPTGDSSDRQIRRFSKAVVTARQLSEAYDVQWV